MRVVEPGFRGGLLREGVAIYFAAIAFFGLGAALACAPVGPAGVEIGIEREEAIVIWDAPAKTQHFIRRASFETRAKDFGFLVPTPAQPELAEADDAAFDHLVRITAPRVIYRDVPSPKGAPPPPAAAAPVTVLATAKVAGFDAAVLEASDAAALNAWLEQHGYVSSPELVDWFKPYLAGGWKITAFKMARDGQTGDNSGSAVRMSFRTERPFFPYREPATRQKRDPAAKGRLLRVYFLADARYAGATGAGRAWPAKTVWSNQIDAWARETVLERVKLPKDAAGGASWLTEFEDRAAPRPGADDVFFTRATDQSALERTPITYGNGLRDLVAGGAVLAAVLAAVLWIALRAMFRQRKKSEKQRPTHPREM